MGLRFLLFFALLIPGLIAGLFNRFAALLVYIGFAMFRPQEWVYTDITWLRLSLVSGVVLVVPALATGVFPNLTHPISVGSVLFLICALIGQTNAVRPDIGWLYLNATSRLILVCLLAVRILDTRRKLLIAIGVFASAVGLHASKVGVEMLLTGGFRLRQGFGGSFGDNNEYALVVVMILPFLIVIARNFESIRGTWPAALRWGWWLSVPLSMLTVFATYSRGGALALVAAAMVFLLLERRKVLAIVAMALLAFVAVLVAGSLPGYRERLETVGADAEDSSARGRLHFWQVALDMSRDWPMGVGLRNFEAMYDAYDTSDGAYGRSRAVHNSHLQVLAETGYAGLVVWTFLFGYAIRASLRLRKAAKDLARPPDERLFYFTLGNAFLTSIVGFLVGGTFLSMALNDATWFIFAFVAVADRLRKQSAVVPVPVQAFPAARPIDGFAGRVARGA